MSGLRVRMRAADLLAELQSVQPDALVSIDTVVDTFDGDQVYVGGYVVGVEVSSTEVELVIE